MKINKTWALFFVVIVLSGFCVTPVFIQLDIRQQMLEKIGLCIAVAPLFYVLSQFLHTFLQRTALFFFGQLFGFYPSVYIRVEERKSYASFFRLYYLFYVLFMVGYYTLFAVVYYQPLLLPLIPLSLILVIIQRFYEREYRQLFLLKSKVVTMIVTKEDCQFSAKDYPDLWQQSPKSALPFIALSYVSLVKAYLSAKERSEIERMEEERFGERHVHMTFVGMFDVLKLNAYLSRSDREQSEKYQDMLETLFRDRPDFLVLKVGIDEVMRDEKSLSLSH